MNKTLRVLLVEDSECDAALIVRQLRKAEYDVASERVEDAPEMRAALGRQEWDIVIADYNLPHFNAPAALALLRETGLDIPFIVVSGAIGEETAVALMRAGAHDYLLKNNLARLPPAVARELEQARLRRERLRMAEALRESEERFRAFFEQAAVGSAELESRTGCFIHVNQCFCDLTGYSMEELTAMTMQAIIPPEDPPEWNDKMVSLLEGKVRQFSVERRCLRKDLSVIWVICTVSSLWMPGEAPTHHLAIVQDITARKTAEEQLRRAKEEAEAASKAKMEFLANMSHEIRTPLNAVIGLSDLLTGMNLAEQQQQYASIIHKRGCDLLGIINDILDLAMIETDRIELVDTELRVERIAGDVIKTIDLEARAKQLAVTFSVAPGIPPVLKGDGLRLKQILLNLLGNAVKFTNAGRVTLTISREECGANHVARPGYFFLLFSVADTGIGIPDGMKETIFDAFFQVDSSYTKRFSGVGLGLAICQRLVNRMGGKIWVESEVGKGSSFFLLLPFKALESDEADRAPETIAQSARRASPMRILVVEDDSISAYLVSEVFSAVGHQVVLAESGREALEAVKGEPFDLVFMDIQMPDMSGIEITAAIRRLEAEGGLPKSPAVMDRRLPIVALTAYAMPGDKERFLAAGMDDYLSKPVLKDSLLDAAERAWRTKTAV